MEFKEEDDEDNDSPQFLKFDNMSDPSKKDNNEIMLKSKLSLRMKLIIFSIIILIIIFIILIIYILIKPKDCESGYFLPNDSSGCQQCSLKNCDKCSGTKESNFCSSCVLNYFPFYENDILKSCNPCNEGCLTCDEREHKCSKCNDGYKLENGLCILNYSFKAIYFVESLNKNVDLISSNYANKIKEIIIDGNIQTEIKNGYNLKFGEHTVYILLDMDLNSKTNNMFSGCQDIKEIYFSSLFNNIEIKSIDNMFKNCKALTSIDFTNFKIKYA